MDGREIEVNRGREEERERRGSGWLSMSEIMEAQTGIHNAQTDRQTDTCVEVRVE